MAVSNVQEKEIKDLLRKKLSEKLSKYSRESSSMPFLSKIVQDNKKVAAYSFLQSVATMLGMSIYEQVSVILAASNSEESKRGLDMDGGISPGQKETIEKIVNDLRSGTREANKDIELKEVLNSPKNNKKKQKEGKVADFYMKRGGIEYYFEIKTAKPNIDVFTTSKKKLLEWIARKDKEIETILAIPYNPYAPEPYSRFTEQGVLEKERELLVADEYWDFIGGEGSYKKLLKIFDEIGSEFKDKIENKITEVARLRYSD